MSHPSKVLVCGPPCAGKSTFVRLNAEPGDLVVDHDVIAQQLGSKGTHHHGRAIRSAAEREVARLLGEIERGEHARWWVIRTAPVEEDRLALARRLGATVELLVPDLATLHARADERPRPDRAKYLIGRWHARAAGEVVNLRKPRPSGRPRGTAGPRVSRWT